MILLQGRPWRTRYYPLKLRGKRRGRVRKGILDYHSIESNSPTTALLASRRTQELTSPERKDLQVETGRHLL